MILKADCIETFEKCSFLLKCKEGENFNHRNTLSISKINPPEAESLTKKLGKKGGFAKVSYLEQAATIESTPQLLYLIVIDTLFQHSG